MGNRFLEKVHKIYGDNLDIANRLGLASSIIGFVYPVFALVALLFGIYLIRETRVNPLSRDSRLRKQRNAGILIIGCALVGLWLGFVRL